MWTPYDLLLHWGPWNWILALVFVVAVAQFIVWLAGQGFGALMSQFWIFFESYTRQTKIIQDKVQSELNDAALKGNYSGATGK